MIVPRRIATRLRRSSSAASAICVRNVALLTFALAIQSAGSATRLSAWQ